MRTSLASGENSLVHALLEILSVRKIFPEEDQPRTRTAECLVCRRRHNVAIVKRTGQCLSSDKSARVRDVSHEECTMLIASSAQLGVVPVSWIRRSTTDDKTRFEEARLLGELSVVNELRSRVKTVRERLEVDGGRCDFLLGSLRKWSE